MDDPNHTIICRMTCGKRSSNCPPEHQMILKMTNKCPGFQPLSQYSMKFRKKLTRKYKLETVEDVS